MPDLLCIASIPSVFSSGSSVRNSGSQSQELNDRYWPGEAIGSMRQLSATSTACTVDPKQLVAATGKQPIELTDSFESDKGLSKKLTTLGPPRTLLKPSCAANQGTALRHHGLAAFLLTPPRWVHALLIASTFPLRRFVALLGGQ
jgi:hypothetical protein